MELTSTKKLPFLAVRLKKKKKKKKKNKTQKIKKKKPPDSHLFSSISLKNFKLRLLLSLQQKT